ncbi:hypothetical protein KP509_05G054700 [Ceratopteris richardii]|nr:hypothetical protein KP509_05G054700 [Ceratopteris richardii]
MASSISFPRSGFSSSPPSSHLSTLDSKFLCYTTEKAHDNAVEPSPPDVRNTIFTTDEFRMYSFKVRPCSRTYSHDWTECPFVHPGENARRRDPRRYHYSCVPCPEFRKGTCRKGDSCEHAHGVFECWLHPAQYRTRICKGGTSCNRRVCFFAHTTEELRPLYISSSYRISPPRSSSSTETSVMSPPRTLASPFSISPSRSCTTNVTAHTSPSSAVPCTLHGPWKNTSMPSLRLPAPILHSSSFPAAFKAHDASMVGSPTWKDQKHVHHTYDPSSKERMSTLSKLDAVICAPSKNIHARVSAQKYRDLGVSLGPSNLEEILSVESSSSSQYVKHKNPLILPESPTGVNRPYSNIILQMQLLESQLSLSEYHLSAPTRASSLNNNNLSQMPLLNGWDAEWQENGDPSTRSMAAASPVAASSPQDKSNSFHNPGSSLKWSEWGSITGEPKWSVQPDYLSKLRKSFSIAKDGNNIEPAWMQKSKDMPVDMGLRIDDECYRQRETNATMSHLELWIDKLKVGQIGS